MHQFACDIYCEANEVPVKSEISTENDFHDADWVDPGRLRTLEVQQLYRQASAALYGAFIASAVVVAVLWDVEDYRRLAAWFVCSVALYLGRYVLVLEFHKRSPQGDDVLPWDRWFTIITALAGALWGTAGVALFPVGSPLHQAALVILIGGTCSGTVVVYCSRKLAYVLFSLLAGLPLAFMFFLQGSSVHLMMGFIVVVYVAVLIVTGNRMHAANRESLRLQLTNQRLVESLTQEKSAVEKLNVSLADEIEERAKTEETLRDNESKYRHFVEFLPQIVFETDVEGKVTFFNQAGKEATGYRSEDLRTGLELIQVIAPDYRQRAARNIDRLLHGELTRGNEYLILCKDGSTIPILSYSAPVVTQGEIAGIRGIAVDVSDLKRAEDQIRADLAEKEVMLREIHHRVKNNLAMVSSLIGLQSHYAPDEIHREAFEETQARIRSMALAHEKLYQTERLADLRADEYLSTLLDELRFTSGQLGSPISVTKHIEPVSLGLDTAIPLGFIANELFSNCVKHAFPDARMGRIHVSFRSDTTGLMELAVKDDGVGIPPEFDLDSPKSLGLILVKTFTRQLHGDMEVRSTEGTEVVVRFREKQR